MLFVRTLAAGFVLLLAIALSGPHARAAAPAAPDAGSASITVNTFIDQWDPPNATGAATLCSLREALEQVYIYNGSRGCVPVTGTPTDFTINLPPGTYTLTHPDQLPDIGPGRAIQIISTATIDGKKAAGRTTGIFRIIGGTLNLFDLTLTNGSRAFGGAVTMGDGVFKAVNVKFLNNGMLTGPVVTVEGGALNNNIGTLLVIDSLFHGNVALSGGAVSANVGSFLNTTFTANEASTGGALYLYNFNASPLLVFESKFINNKALRPTSFVPPKDDPYGGGAIANNGNLELKNSLLRDNRSQQTKGGAGLWNMVNGAAELHECVFTNNLATNNGSVLVDSWGGAILNHGELDLIRCSIHGNQADYAGGIFGAFGSSTRLYNSTVSNNHAAVLHGGLMIESGFFDVNTGAAEARLTHATVGPNSAPSNNNLSNNLYSAAPYTIVLANSIIASACETIVYTFGRSVLTGPCTSEPYPPPVPGAVDNPNIPPANIGLLPLSLGIVSQGNPAAAFFMVHQLGGLAAVDIGRDDQYGCAHLNVGRQDQSLADRPIGECDAGAIEAGANPPQYESEPVPGVVNFETVKFNEGDVVAVMNLVVRNSGGGALTYRVVDKQGPYGYEAISRMISQPGEGVLFAGQEVSLTFSCEPTQVNDFYHTFVIETNLRVGFSKEYRFHCAGAGEEAMASTDEQPGAHNLDATQPNQTAQTELAITNRGEQPLTVDPALDQTVPMWALLTQPGLSLAEGQSPDQPQSPLAVLQPGQSLIAEVSCTPPGPGIFLNTLRFTTSDPGNAVIDYDLACEGLITSPPEPLEPGTFYTSSSGGVSTISVAVSPDGLQLLAGQANSTLRAWRRDLNTGELTVPTSHPVANMAEIYDIAYSRNGKNVYYSSHTGDGVVVLNRAGLSLNLAQVITRTSTYVCAPPNVQCPIDRMNGARGIALSPDDQYLYVTGFDDDSLTVLSRNLANGVLTYTQSFTRTIDGVNVLDGAARVVVSPNGAHVYVVATIEDTLSVFQRQDGGQLILKHVYRDGTGGIDNLNNPADVAISSDGQYVYVPGIVDGALNIFERSSADGGLTLIQSITGLNAPWTVETSHDEAGERIFLGYYAPDKVEAYARDAATGQLSLLDTVENNVPPGSNVSGPFFMVMSPDNQQLYVALYDGQAVRQLNSVPNAPVLSRISPAAAEVNSPDLTLTVRGGRFYPSSVVLFGVGPLSTVFVSENELQAVVPAGFLDPPLANTPVRVVTGAPGGGTTDPVTFSVVATGALLVPSIDLLIPPEAEFGTDELSVIIYGSNFTSESQVTYNGQPVPTSYMGSEALQAYLSTEILQAPGTGGLAVINGTAGTFASSLDAGAAPEAPTATGTSAIAGFHVGAPGEAVLPSIGHLAPGSILSGSAESWVTVVGNGFSDASVGRWNGQARNTVVVNGNTLMLLATANDLNVPGNVLITVFTAGTGGSEPVIFRVRPPGEKPVPVIADYAVLGGSPVTLYVSGSDFDAGAQISVNGVAQVTTFVHDSLLSMPLTGGSQGGLMTVTNPGPGGGASNVLAFVVKRQFLPSVRR